MDRSQRTTRHRSRPTLWPLALLALIAPAPSSAAGADRFSAALEQGVASLEAGHPAEAAAAARLALSAEPGETVALVLKGSAELAAFDVLSASQTFRSALAQPPATPSAWLGAAACETFAGRYRAAAGLYRGALAADGVAAPEARACLAYALAASGDRRTARAELEAIPQDARPPLATEVEIALLLADGTPAQALQPLASLTRSALPLAPTFPAQMVCAAPALWLHPEPHATTATALQTTADGAAIVHPRAGDVVSGDITVEARVDDGVELARLTLAVDGKFRAMSNVPPFRLQLDTRTCPDGPHELSVEGVGSSGRIVCRASIIVVTANGGQRTYTPEVAAARAAAEQRLQGWLALRPHPLNRTYLLGRVRDAQGQLRQAIPAYEYVFAAEPTYPSARRALLAAYQRLRIAPPPSGLDAVRSLPTGKRTVALTFDDGPTPTFTPSLLDQLDEYGAKATFFLIGKQAELYPELVRTICDRGHELACHSYSHTDQTKLSPLDVERELIKTRVIIREASSQFVTLFRPPGGNYDAEVDRAVRAMNFTPVFWTAAVTTYAGLPADTGARKMLAEIDDGAIVLLHNGYDETVGVLPILLRELHRRGYAFHTISQALGHPTTLAWSELPATSVSGE